MGRARDVKKIWTRWMERDVGEKKGEKNNIIFRITIGTIFSSSGTEIHDKTAYLSIYIHAYSQPRNVSKLNSVPNSGSIAVRQYCTPSDGRNTIPCRRFPYLLAVHRRTKVHLPDVLASAENIFERGFWARIIQNKPWLRRGVRRGHHTLSAKGKAISDPSGGRDVRGARVAPGELSADGDVPSAGGQHRAEGSPAKRPKRYRTARPRGRGGRSSLQGRGGHRERRRGGELLLRHHRGVRRRDGERYDRPKLPTKGELYRTRGNFWRAGRSVETKSSNGELHCPGKGQNAPRHVPDAVDPRERFADNGHDPSAQDERARSSR